MEDTVLPVRHHQVALLHVGRHDAHRFELQIVFHVLVHVFSVFDGVPNARQGPADQIFDLNHLRAFELRPLVGHRLFVPVNARNTPRLGRAELLGPVQNGDEGTVELDESAEVRVDPLRVECRSRFFKTCEDLVLRAFYVLDGTGKQIEAE
ncbi:MAG: hypothetical protein BRD41_05720 [Bacteroidetes bacterium QS_1_63_11]|nr:MAG: hypothetical protein BRD41_05720 [Bacteroidetes bacterium QS_1_63_11]